MDIKIMLTSHINLSFIERAINRQHFVLHRILVQIENDQDEYSRKEAVTDALNSMFEYAHKHLKLEENAMKLINYPDFDQHKKKHREFYNRTVEFCVNMSVLRQLTSKEVVVYLRKWLDDHKLEDEKVIQHLREFTKHKFFVP